MFCIWIKYSCKVLTNSARSKCEESSQRHTVIMTNTADLDVHQTPTRNRSVFRCLEEWSGGLWEPVSAQFPLLSSHSPGEPVSWGQLGGTVSCLKSSQFTGPFKVSTPTRGPQDYKNYKHWAVQARIWDTQMHTCMHTCTRTHQLLTAHLSLIQRTDNSKDKDIICVGCF